MKSGTTSLWNYLGQHPDIFMCPVKEPRYFAVKGFAPDKKEIVKNHPLWRNTVINKIDYLKLFEGVKNEKVVGEASPLYMVYPFVSKNILEEAPNAKILVCLRHPVDRAFSHFNHNRSYGVEKRESFVDAFYKDALCHYAGYYRLGLYAQQLRSYFDSFPRERIKICIYEQLVEFPVETIQSIFKFAKVDQDFEPDTSIVYLKGTVNKALNPEIKKNLTLAYLEDLKQLQNLIEVDLSQWLQEESGEIKVDEDEKYYSPWFYV